MVAAALAAWACGVFGAATAMAQPPALHHGETVLLCWQLGEDDIAWWHRVDDGFAGRRPLPLD